MAIQISSTAVINNSRKGIFTSMNPGVFANASRPGSPATGDVLYSSTNSELQVWNGSAWASV